MQRKKPRSQYFHRIRLVYDLSKQQRVIIQEFKVGGYPWFSYIKQKNRLFIKKRLIYWAVLLSEITLAAPYIRPGDSQANILYRTWAFLYISYLSYLGAQPIFPNLNNKTRPDNPTNLYIIQFILYISNHSYIYNLIIRPDPTQKKTAISGGFCFGVAV